MSKAKPERKFCSRLALAAEEPLAGSALHYKKYIFIGLPKGQWAPNAALSKGVPEDLSALLKSLKGDPRRIAVRFFNMKEGDERTDIIVCPDMKRLKCLPMKNMANIVGDLLEGNFPECETEKLGGKHLFICTHGVRDMCCAKFGYGTIRGLRNSIKENRPRNDWHIWETTHLVGDRFAGTGIQFPEGHMYGYLSEDIAKDWLATLDRGEIDLGRYRGNIFLTSPQQVTEIAVLEWAKLKSMNVEVKLDSPDERGVGFEISEVGKPFRRGHVSLEEREVAYYTNCQFAAAGKKSRKKSWVASNIQFGDEVALEKQCQ